MFYGMIDTGMILKKHIDCEIKQFFNKLIEEMIDKTGYIKGKNEVAHEE